MKKIILASVALAALAGTAGMADAATATFCAGGTGGNGGTATTDTTTFVKTAFTAKCSANTHVLGDDNGTYYRVAAASVKGKFPFYGSTMGGGVVASTVSCAATGCAATDASTAVTLGAST